MSQRTRRILAALGGALVLAVVAFGLWQPASAEPLMQTVRRFAFPAEYRTGTTGAAFQVRQDGSGSILNLQDGSVSEYTFDQSSATFTNPLVSNGGLDANGQEVTLDADADTSLTADTDDQVDVEIGGADIMTLKDFGTATLGGAGTTRHLFEIADSTNVMTTGTNVLSFLNIDAGIGNSTGGTNSVHGLLIDDISGDAQNTETAITVGTGWDLGLDLSGTPLDLDADNDTSITADTDDQIDIEISGADDFRFTANTLTVLSGSTLAVPSGAAADIDGTVDLDGVVTNADGLEHMMFPTYATASFTYTAAAGGTVQLFTIGASEEWIVHGLWLEVTTNFDAVGDDAVVHLGDSNDTDGFCVLSDTELQTADTEGTGWKAGWQCQVAATRGVYQDGTGGFIYDGTETIDAVISAAGNDLSAGAATAHILYTRIQ